MASGNYGSNAHYVDELKKRKKRLATKLMWRELGVEPMGAQRRAAQAMPQVCMHMSSILAGGIKYLRYYRT